MITRNQKIALAILTIVMALDAAISINGAWNHNATFYEANPVFAAFITVEWFTVAVIVLKLAAIGIVAVTVSALNKEPGIQWGNALACGSACCFTMLVATMAIINVMI